MDANQALGILGLGTDATPDEIKDVYRDLTKVWHPDRFANDPRLQQRAEEKFKIINEAYQVLQGHPFRPIIETSGSPATPAQHGPPERSRNTERNRRGAQTRAPARPGARPAFLAYGLIGVVIVGSVEYAVWRHRTSEARNSPSTRQASPSPPPQQNGVDTSLAKPGDEGPASMAETPKRVDSTGHGGTELKRRTRRESRLDPTSGIKENGASPDTRSRSTTPSEDRLSSEESASLEAACAQAKSPEGPTAYNRCIEDHLALLASAPHRPDLSKLSEPERQSIESACSKAKYLEGPAAYYQCLQEQFVRWTTAQPRPDLSGLTSPERESIEEACSQSKNFEGPKSYNVCLRDQLERLAKTPKPPNLSDLTVPERESIEAICSQATHLAGPAAYNSCLIKQVALLKVRQ